MADSKLSDLTAITTPADTDLLYLVHDPAGTPVDRKVTVADLRGASGGPTIHRVTRSGAGNYTTTSASKTPIDATNLGFQTVTLAVGDLVKCTLVGQGYSDGSAGACGFDFEVDQPTSANVYIGSGNDYGVSANQHGARTPLSVTGEFVATEAGVHGFRPTWGPVSGGTITLCNAASGADDTLILFSVEVWPAAQVF